jgi:hypothetical protein
MGTKALNRGVPYTVALFLSAILLALTGESRAGSYDRRVRDQITQYRVFMEKHPKASTRLRENPQLVYDDKFLKKHREVGDFLKRRPELRHEIARRPHRVFEEYYREDYRNGRFNRDERRFGWWRY